MPASLAYKGFFNLSFYLSIVPSLRCGAQSRNIVAYKGRKINERLAPKRRAYFMAILICNDHFRRL